MVFYLRLFCFCAITILSQGLRGQFCISISGKITDSIHKPLQSVIIVTSVLNKKYYSTSNNKGSFLLKYCYENDSIIKQQVKITFKMVGYTETTISLNPSIGNNNLSDIILQAQENILQEVIVQNKPIVQKGDTTIFTLGAFKNKLDGNLEDVLKRMPGFDVNESGEILYNNKPIESILIEGDELSKNYKLISKNIPPDAIDKLQMIDKYENNPLFKGLTRSRKQAINLTLKNPSHLNIFGNMKMGIGVEGKKNLTGNLFGVNSKFKSLVLSNINNIGTSPYEEISFDQKTTQTKDYEFDNTLIPNQVAESQLFTKPLLNNMPNSLFNNSIMATANNSFKINKTLSAKLFFDTYSDIILQSQQSNLINYINPFLSYTTISQKLFTPKNSNYFFQLKHLSTKSQLLLTTTLENKKYGETDTISSTLNYNSCINSTYKRLGIASYYTNRIDSNKAIEFSFQYIHDQKNQDYLIVHDSLRIVNPNYQTNEQYQNTSTLLDYFKGDIKYLFKGNNSLPNELRITNTYYNAVPISVFALGLNRSLYGNPDNYQNKNYIKANKLQFSYSKELNSNKVSASISAGISVLNNTYYFSKSPTEKVSFILPIGSLNLKYKLTNKQDISYNIDFNSNYPSIITVNENSILTSFRTFTSNTFWSKNIPYFQSSLTYLFRDIDNGTSLILSWLNYKQLYTQVSNINFTKDFDYYKTRYINEQQNQNTLFMKFDKYISSIKSSFNLKQSLTWFSKPLESNNTIISNRNFVYSLNGSFRPSINNNISISSGVNFNLSKDISSGKIVHQIGPFINTTTNITSKFSMGAICNYFADNYAIQKNNYWFANIYFWYTIKQSKADLKITISNIFNTSDIFTGTKNDLFSQYNKQTILPRFSLFEFIYKF